MHKKQKKKKIFGLKMPYDFKENYCLFITILLLLETSSLPKIFLYPSVLANVGWWNATSTATLPGSGSKDKMLLRISGLVQLNVLWQDYSCHSDLRWPLGKKETCLLRNWNPKPFQAVHESSCCSRALCSFWYASLQHYLTHSQHPHHTIFICLKWG